MDTSVYAEVLKPRFTFEDIAGYEEVKERFFEMLTMPFKYSGALKRAGMKPPTGVIAWGPLGTGKGHMIEAAADAADVGYVIIRGRECTDQPEAVRKGFELAVEVRPSIIHVMDIDWLAPRSDAGFGWSDGTTDGKPDRFGSEEVHETVIREVAKLSKMEDVMVGASCYRIDTLDQAFTRVTMIGRKIYVPPPGLEDRKAILEHYFAKAELAGDLDLKKAAELTENYVGWDIEALCRKAVMSAAKRGGEKEQVKMSDFKAALKDVRPWLSPEMTRDYARIRAEDCLHKYNF